MREQRKLNESQTLSPPPNNDRLKLEKSSIDRSKILIFLYSNEYFEKSNNQQDYFQIHERSVNVEIPQLNLVLPHSSETSLIDLISNLIFDRY